MMTEITVNGRRRAFGDAPAHATALEWLRSRGVNGCKEGCAEGECGACAALVLAEGPGGEAIWRSVNTCLIPAASLDGQEIVTAEGLGTPDKLHPVQRRLAEAGGSQCGFCTPGFACSMAAEYYRPDRADQADEATGGPDGSDRAGSATAAVPDAAGSDTAAPDAAGDEIGPNGFDLRALSGNLCRCTGYRPIRDAAFVLGQPQPDDELATRRSTPAPDPVATDVSASDGRFVRPETLDDALAILAESPDAVPVAGSTDWGVEVTIRGRRVPLVVAIDRLDELRHRAIGDDWIEIGAAVTLSEAEEFLGDRVPLLAEMFDLFASRPIRNRATLGGNLGTGSPIGDGPPALLALGAHVELAGPAGVRDIDLADYFTGYRKTLRQPGELIRSIRIPRTLAGLTAFHKIAKRRFDDISSVAAAFALDITGNTVTAAKIGLGGVAATPLRATATEEALVGREWSRETVDEVSHVLAAEGTPMSDHRASAEYRSAMLGQAILKLFSRNDTLQGAK